MDVRRIVVFVVLSYAISWSVAVAMYVAGIEYGSLTSLVLLAAVYMPAPHLRR